jgi:hypothetical protein
VAACPPFRTSSGMRTRLYNSLHNGDTRRVRESLWPRSSDESSSGFLQSAWQMLWGRQSSEGKRLMYREPMNAGPTIGGA